jgi:EpsI family protein
MISKGRVVTVLALLAVTWYILQTTTEVTAVPVKKSLSLFPKQIAGYHLSNSFQSSAEVLEMLGVDDYIQYNYIDEAKTNSRINLYAGFYKAVGVSGSYHSPKNCLPGGGWGIDRVQKVSLQTGIGGNDQAVVSEMLIRNGSEYQVVLYWYQNRGRIIASEYWEKIYLVLDALFKGRRDGTFVRIMTVAQDGDIEAAREQVQKFAEQVMPLLENHLPGASL